MNYKGSKSEKNLYKTFAGESRVRTKYSIYAEAARCEGYRWVAEIFDETSDNEKAHAREVLVRFLKKVGNTEENLLDALLGEEEENDKLYKEYEETAREEGFFELADFYKELREVEEEHAKRFKILALKIKNDKMFKSSEETLWSCMNCGYIHEGYSAPDNCPLCNYPKEYFKPYCNVNE